MNAMMPLDPAVPRRRKLRIVGIVLLLAAIVYVAGLIRFAEDIPRAPRAPDETTDAVVVLTGGPLRLKEGLALLAEGRAKKLFVSGVNRGVELGELLRVAGTPPDAIACCVELGYAAYNTAGNAEETRAWMEKEGFRSLRLVTANYHMRRSLLEFRSAMPDLRIVPHAVAPDSFKREDWWEWRGTATLVFVEYNKFLFTFLRNAMQKLVQRPEPA
jgi:uncharacterized SAM-binding protein YcdF (DUF218 family)